MITINLGAFHSRLLLKPNKYISWHGEARAAAIAANSFLDEPVFVPDAYIKLCIIKFFIRRERFKLVTTP